MIWVSCCGVSPPALFPKYKACEPQPLVETPFHPTTPKIELLSHGMAALCRNRTVVEIKSGNSIEFWKLAKPLTAGSSRKLPSSCDPRGRRCPLARAKTPDRQRANGGNILNVRWRKTSSTRRREILLPAGLPPQHARPIRSCALLVASIARGRRWLDELLADTNANAESIAKRERCSIRKVNMTISLAFLAPDLVQAAIAGRLPHGMGVARLADMPAEWSRQHQMLGLPSALTGIRTVSLPLAVSVSGKRDFGAREKCAETTCRLTRVEMPGPNQVFEL